MSLPDRLRPIDLDAAFARAAEQVAEGTAPFVILAVADAAGGIRAEAFAGPAAPDVTVDSICLVASITKAVVATGVMQLVADGRVALTDPVDLHVPAFAAPGKPTVTVWHLLAHTSGIPDYDLRALLLEGADRMELLRAVCAATPAFAPGSRYAYASSTFDLLAAVIERVTGEPFAAYLRRTIWEPLGLADTTFEPWGHGARVAPLFFATPAGSEPRWLPHGLSDVALRARTAMQLAGAGLFSSAGDLVRFGRAMLRGGTLDDARILAAPYVELMTREQTTATLGAAADPILAEHYALGWGKPDPRTSPASPAAYGHGGATGTTLWIDPAHDLVVVYLTGVFDFPSRPRDLVLRAVYGALR